MLPLWRAMYDQYRIDFPQWVDDATYDRATAVIDATPKWWAELVAMPRTLVHNDFNPRNIALRKGSGLVAYDWELATVQVPQRDLVDLLAHVLGPDASPESVDHFVEFQRRALESASGIHVGCRCMATRIPAQPRRTQCQPPADNCARPALAATALVRPSRADHQAARGHRTRPYSPRGRPMRLKSIAVLAMSRSRLVLVAALLFLIVSGAVGADAIEKLSSGGFNDPGSESVHADRQLRDTFGIAVPTLVLLASADAPIDSPEVAAAGRELVDRLAHSKTSSKSQSYLDVRATRRDTAEQGRP